MYDIYNMASYFVFAHVWYIQHGELLRICQHFKKPHYLDDLYVIGKYEVTKIKPLANEKTTNF